MTLALNIKFLLVIYLSFFSFLLLALSLFNAYSASFSLYLSFFFLKLQYFFYHFLFSFFFSSVSLCFLSSFFVSFSFLKHLHWSFPSSLSFSPSSPFLCSFFYHYPFLSFSPSSFLSSYPSLPSPPSLPSFIFDVLSYSPLRLLSFLIILLSPLFFPPLPSSSRAPSPFAPSFPLLALPLP